MFGNIVEAAKAPVGTLMLGHERISPGAIEPEMALYVPLSEPSVCLVVPTNGNAFTPTRNWLYGNRWDVTSVGKFRVEPKQFLLDDNDPTQGELGYASGDWYIRANLSDRGTWPGWVNVKSGEVIQQRLELIRFQSWSFVCEADGRTFPIIERNHSKVVKATSALSV